MDWPIEPLASCHRQTDGAESSALCSIVISHSSNRKCELVAEKNGWVKEINPGIKSTELNPVHFNLTKEMYAIQFGNVPKYPKKIRN